MLLKLCGPPLTCSMNDANVLASLKVPWLLIVAPFQNWIALLLAAVLPAQVVVFSRLTVPPPTITFGFGPEIVTSLANVVTAVPEKLPPVHVAGPWKVRSVPVIVAAAEQERRGERAAVERHHGVGADVLRADDEGARALDRRVVERVAAVPELERRARGQVVDAACSMSCVPCISIVPALTLVVPVLL